MINKKAKLNFRILSPVLFLLLIGVTSCEKDPLISNYAECNGNTILEFSSILDMQTKYNELRAAYDAAADDQPLIDFENRNVFYSLRKKDRDMDEGLIPDDPLFEIYDYSPDDVVCTLLNAEGIVIIGDEIYIWSSGCIGYKAPYNCTNYKALEKLMSEFRDGTINDNGFQVYLNTYNIELVNLCADEFEFESNYDGHTQEGGSNRDGGCALEAGISAKIISNNNITKVVEIELTAWNINTGVNVLNAWEFKSSGTDDESQGDDTPSINGSEVKIIGGSNPSFVNQLWNQLGNGYYVGKVLIIEVDYTSLNFLDVRLLSNNVDFSCHVYDYKSIPLACPIFLNAEPLNASSGQWKFSIEGLEPGQPGGWEWDFGDGSMPVWSSNRSKTYNYNIPCCEGEKHTISVQDAEGTMPCNFPLIERITIGNPCRLSKFKDKVKLIKQPNHNNKDRKVALMHKMKKTGKIKTWGRHWSKGIKQLEVLQGGQVWFSQGGNCISEELALIMQNGSDGNPATLNKKRRVKQRNAIIAFLGGRRYCIDLSSPYTIRYTTANGFIYDYTKSSACLSVQ